MSPRVVLALPLLVAADVCRELGHLVAGQHRPRTCVVESDQHAVWLAGTERVLAARIAHDE